MNEWMKKLWWRNKSLFMAFMKFSKKKNGKLFYVAAKRQWGRERERNGERVKGEKNDALKNVRCAPVEFYRLQTIATANASYLLSRYMKINTARGRQGGGGEERETIKYCHHVIMIHIRLDTNSYIYLSIQWTSANTINIYWICQFIEKNFSLPSFTSISIFIFSLMWMETHSHTHTDPYVNPVYSQSTLCLLKRRKFSHPHKHPSFPPPRIFLLTPLNSLKKRRKEKRREFSINHSKQLESN